MRLCSYLSLSSFSRAGETDEITEEKTFKKKRIIVMDLNSTAAAAVMEAAATGDPLDDSHDYEGLAIVFVSVWGQVNTLHSTHRATRIH